MAPDAGPAATAARPPAATREALGPTLTRLHRDEGLDIVVVDADLGKSTSARKFGEAFPERFFTMGVAEANMISVAAGMASIGHTVFASTFAVFGERAFDQLRMSVAQPGLDVKLFASHGGVSTGEDGASAQAIEDLALMCSLVGMRVIVPADVVEAEAAVEAAARTPGPFYIRTSRPKTPVLYTEGPRFRLGRAHRMREGGDLTIVACGLMVERALLAADRLAGEGIKARVLNMATLRPLDAEALEAAARETGAIVVAEEHLAHSGLGGLCAHALASRAPVPMEFVAVPERYGESATWSQALELMGLTVEGIVLASRRVLEHRARASG